MSAATRWRAALLAALTLGATVLGAEPAVAGPPGPPVPRLDWGTCAAGSPAADAGGFQCATATVPSDYARPGATITLALVRRPATGRKIGTLFINPGGPGGTGTGQIPAWIPLLPAGLQERFDVVSWDPRGVGQSTPVQCFDNGDQEGAFLGDNQYFPPGPAQQRSYVDTWRGFGQRCAQRAGALLPHVSTADTARDLDLLRQAVGDAKLTYLGLSYGTFLGATYANLFPDKVRALILDGNVAPSSWTGVGRELSTGAAGRIGSGAAVATALDAMLRLCGGTDAAHCPLTGGDPARTKAKFDQLVARLRQGPIVVNGAPVTYAQILSEIGDGLDIVQPFASKVEGTSSAGWTGLSAALQKLWQLRDTPPPPPAAPAPAPPAGPVEPYPGPDAATAIQCGDSPVAPTARFPGLAAQAERRDGPVSLPALWGDEICSTWPAAAAAPYRGPFDRVRTPVLVLNTTTDPATPIDNATRMVSELGGGARLLTVNGFGHTVFLNPSACAAQAEVAYLTDLTLPRQGTVCPQDRPPFATVAGGA